MTNLDQLLTQLFEAKQSINLDKIWSLPKSFLNRDSTVLQKSISLLFATKVPWTQITKKYFSAVQWNLDLRKILGVTKLYLNSYPVIILNLLDKMRAKYTVKLQTSTLATD